MSGDDVRDALSALLDRIGEFTPQILAAAGLVLLGWLVARVVQSIVGRLLGGWSNTLERGASRLFGGAAAEAGLRRARPGEPVGDAIGRLIFWLVFLLLVAGATEALSLPVLSTWIVGVAGYLPRVLAAALILLLGVLAGSVIRNLTTQTAASAGFAYSALAGRAAQIVTVLITVVVAFDQLGLEITFLIVVSAIVIGASFGGAALGFGLGSRTTVSNILGAHYVARSYRVGQRVRIGAVEGEIVELTPTAVIIQSSDGRVLVPAKDFGERESVLLSQ